MRAAGFTHVVPLGLSCRVTYQLRRHFRSATAFPFDWWYTPIEGLARYLADPDPDRLFGPRALEERTEDGRVSTIASREFGFQLFHEFPRHKEEAPVAVVSGGWRDHVAAARERYLRRMERLAQTDRPGNRVLFVRHQLGLEIAPESAGRAVEALWRSLAAGWRHAEIRLLLVNLPPLDGLRPQVQQLHFDDPPGPPPESWRGDDARWTSGLEIRGLRARA